MQSTQHTWCLVLLLLRAQWCQEWGYLLIGTAAALPVVVLPLFLQSKADAAKPRHQRYWVKVRCGRESRVDCAREHVEDGGQQGHSGGLAGRPGNRE
jgi:hypothetical protein